MNRSRDEFLPCAGLAGDEYRRVADSGLARAKEHRRRIHEMTQRLSFGVSVIPKVGDDIRLSVGHPCCNGAPLGIHARDDTMNRPGAMLNLITVLSPGSNPRVSNFSDCGAKLI